MKSRLRRYVPIIIPVVAVLLIIALIVWFFNREIDPETLAKNRDMAIILSSMLLAFGMFLFAVMIGIIIWLLLVMKDKVVPTLDLINATVQRVKETTDTVAETVVDTSQRVKTTTDFVTEEVASPLIKAYGLVAQGRAWMKVVTGRNTKPEGSPRSRAFRKPE